MPIDSLTPELAGRLLSGQGVRVGAALRVIARDDRWMVDLGDGRLAWFAASEEGRTLLRRERRILRLLEAKCSFCAPRVLFEDPSGDFDLRAKVPGVADPWVVFDVVCRRADVAAQLGESIGTILADQHTHVGADDVAGWLPPSPGWPESAAWIAERLVKVVEDSDLIADALGVIDAYHGLAVADEDRALVHGDLGFHNLGISLNPPTVHGVFDYADAAWADRHHDFRYLVFDRDAEQLFEAALRVYEPATGKRIDRKRVFLYNAACAVTFLAYRMGTPPHEKSCGRTLTEDLRWSRHALARARDWL